MRATRRGSARPPTRFRRSLQHPMARTDINGNAGSISSRKRALGLEALSRARGRPPRGFELESCRCTMQNLERVNLQNEPRCVGPPRREACAGWRASDALRGRSDPPYRRSLRGNAGRARR
jgi:hypothetical protein